jgi:carbamoyl-phosphate synthase large subunit
MKKRNILVFPAGTEIGLEIHAALKQSKEVRVFGAGQDISNHARFAFSEYYTVPSIHEDGWLESLIDLCKKLSIDYIFPAYDDVIVALSKYHELLPAKVISAEPDVCEITRSKKSTYHRLAGCIRVPVLYETAEQVTIFPVLVKPDRGQGSYGIRRVNNQSELYSSISSIQDGIICEYLPGEEYTVDCFSDRERGLLFASARSRRRTRNGISVNTITETVAGVTEIAEKIHTELRMRGAWFFQLKRAIDGGLTLLEVAPRIAGAMVTHRVMGVNFPLLSILEEERTPLSILTNPGIIELDRALVNRFSHEIKFETLYVDLDDTLIFDGKVNTEIIRLIYQCINNKKMVKLITRHREELSKTLAKHRLTGLFDEVIHLKSNESKSAYIIDKCAVFIDDSFAERQEVQSATGIPTFDCSMVELLTQQSEFLNGAGK